LAAKQYSALQNVTISRWLPFYFDDHQLRPVTLSFYVKTRLKISCELGTKHLICTSRVLLLLVFFR